MQSVIIWKNNVLKKNLNFNLLLIGIGFVLITIYFLFANNIFPLAAHDSFAYTVPAVNLKNNNGLTNPLWQRTIEFDETKNAYFLQYPPLFQYVVAFLMLDGTPKSAFVSIAILNSLTLLLFLFLLISILGRLESKLSIGMKILAVLSLGAVSTHLAISTAGRPEAIAGVIILLICCFLYFPKRHSTITIGVLFGFLSLAHPIGFIYSFVGLGLFYAKLNSWKSILIELTKVGFISSILFLIGMELMSPVGLITNLKGIFSHSDDMVFRKTIFGANTIKEYTQYWFTYTSASFHGFIIIFGLFFGIRLIIKNKELDSTHLLTIGGLVSLMFFVLYYFSGKNAWASYNLWLFSPVLCLIILCYVGKLEKKWHLVSLIWSNTMFALASLSFVRYFTLFCFFFIPTGEKLGDAETAFKEVQKKHDSVVISMSLWVLTSDYSNIYFNRELSLEDKKISGGNNQALVLQQQSVGVVKFYNDKSMNEPEISGYNIVSSTFTKEKAILFGAKLSNFIPGYSILVYTADNKTTD